MNHRGSKDEDEYVVETRGRIAAHRNQWANLCTFRVRGRASSSDRLSDLATCTAPHPSAGCFYCLDVRTNVAGPLQLCTALVNCDLGINMHVPQLKKLYKIPEPFKWRGATCQINKQSQLRRSGD
jgi:hypothetical protein